MRNLKPRCTFAPTANALAAVIALAVSAVAVSALTARVSFAQTPAVDEDSASAKAIFPEMKNHGGVIKLPSAAQQPRSGTKFLVDVTRGAEPDRLNGAFEKVAKYVNLYAGAGVQPAKVRIAVVLHGDATAAALSGDAYSTEYATDGNPNLTLMRRLREAGVVFYVCGQSLHAMGADMKDVSDVVQPAVSALTAVVNLQANGYAYVPLLQQ